jgi:hypothetical protein
MAAYARVSSDKEEKEQTIEALVRLRGGGVGGYLA